MKLETARDAVNHARSFHRELSRFYHRLGTETASERTRLLLDYLSRHERHLEQRLRRCENEMEPGALDSWFRNSPDETELLPLFKFEVNPAMLYEELLRNAIEQDERMAGFFHELAETAPNAAVRDFFNTLCTVERNQKFHLAKNAQMLHDL